MSQRGGVRAAVAVVGTVVGTGAVLLGVLIAGMRWNVAPVMDAVRRLNRSVTNPRVMRTAANTQTSVIRHVGRTSGRTFHAGRLNPDVLRVSLYES